MAGTLTTVWLAGGAALEAWLLAYGGKAHAPGLALAVAVAAQATGTAIGLSARRVPPPWVGNAIMFGALGAVSAVVWALRGVESGVELVYLWPVPYAFVLVKRRMAVIHVTLAGTAWLLCTLETSPSPDAGRWVFVVATGSVIALVSAHLLTTLLGSQQLLNRAFADAPIATAFTDAQGHWIAVNAAFGELLGRSTAELDGAAVTDVLDEHATEPQRLRHPSGRNVWVQTTRAPVRDDQGATVCWSVQAIDVTARRAIEASLRADADQARWADEVKEALREERVVLYSQPLFTLVDGARCGQELLARLQRRDGTIIAPGLFMPAVERFDMAAEFDAYILRRAVAVIASGHPAHVNLSAQSVGRPDVLHLLKSTLCEASANPGLLTIEITETALTDNMDRFVSFGNEITSLGCRLALDDFGTGYGALTYLTALPVHEIKIDQQFVRLIANDHASHEVVRAIVGLAHRLNITTVAEGVEDTITLQAVQALGVDLVQGYLLGRPQPLTDHDPARPKLVSRP